MQLPLNLDNNDIVLVRALFRKIVRPLFTEGKTPSVDDFANAIEKFVCQTTYLESNPTPIVGSIMHMGRLLCITEALSTARYQCKWDSLKDQVLKLDEEIAEVKASLAELKTETPLILHKIAKRKRQGAECLKKINDFKISLYLQVLLYNSYQRDLNHYESELQNNESLAAKKTLILSELETAQARTSNLATSATSKHALLDQSYQSSMKSIREACGDFDL